MRLASDAMLRTKGLRNDYEVMIIINLYFTDSYSSVKTVMVYDACPWSH